MFLELSQKPHIIFLVPWEDQSGDLEIACKPSYTETMVERPTVGTVVPSTDTGMTKSSSH